MKLNDIEGAKAKQLHYARENAKGYSAMDYSDVNNDMKRPISSRRIDPLNPFYKCRDEN
jgi:hypothetical protein